MNAIEIAGLGKQYRIHQRPAANTARDVIAETLARGLGRLRRTTAAEGPLGKSDHFWALRDLELTIPTGQAIGVIGPNGAGKSTLLKILSRVTEPTTGVARIRGRVGSLLEVGTGFHSELTGRENMFLSGAILGMGREDIRRRFDEIVAFAGVEPFLDTPVKHYSSGMYLRLAFSVAAHLDPDILIVDEVLAVGDAEFQQKCLGRMDSVVSEGRTVLLVSHNLEAVRSLCSRCLLLREGRLDRDGTPGEVTRAYLSQRRAFAAPGKWIELSASHRRGTGEVRFERVRYQAEGAPSGHPEPDAPIRFDLQVRSDADRELGSLAVTLSTLEGHKLVNTDTLFTGEVLPLRQGENSISVQVSALHLQPGVYRVALWAADPIRSQADGGPFDYFPHAFEIEVCSATANSLGLESNCLVTSETRSMLRSGFAVDDP